MNLLLSFNSPNTALGIVTTTSPGPPASSSTTVVAVIPTSLISVLVIVSPAAVYILLSHPSICNPMFHLKFSAKLTFVPSTPFVLPPSAPVLKNRKNVCLLKPVAPPHGLSMFAT